MVTATANGGNGGSGSGGGFSGGAGGVGKAKATGNATSGTTQATVSQSVGTGGYGYAGAKGGAGAASTLANAVTGSTTGGLTNGTATANGGTASGTGGSATAAAAGTSASNNDVTANATAASAGTVGGNGTASAITTSIGATDAVRSADAAATNASGVSSQGQANISGNWFGTPSTSTNGCGAYAAAMGAPTASVVSTYLAGVTLPAHASIFGAGVLGANYSTSSTGTDIYTATSTHHYTLSGSNALDLGLLTIGSYGSGFSSLTFTVTEGTTTLLTKTFSSLTGSGGASSYFAKDLVSLGNVTGSVNLTLSFRLTETAPGGVGISYLVADAPAAAKIGVVRLRSTGSWTFNPARFSADGKPTTQLVRLPEKPTRRIKAPHR